MREQIDFSRSTEFENFLAGLFKLDIPSIGQFVQGLVVDIHPTWRQYWDIWKRTGINLNEAGFPFPFEFGPFHHNNIAPGIGAPDPTWTCNIWEHLKQRQGKSSGGSFIVKICTKPFGVTPPEISILQKYAEVQPFFCVLEERQPARAIASIGGGGQISTGLHNGTLGGFLRDQNANEYGVTCAHVAMAPTATFDLHDVSGVTLSNAATIAYSSFDDLDKLGKGQLCNRAATGKQVPDVALLRLDPAHSGSATIKSIGTIDDVLTESDLGSGSSVEMKAASGYHSAYVGGYSVVYNILFDDGNEYCFDHMFEVVSRSSSSFASLIPPALTSKPVSGDSGAWVCAPSRKGSGNYGLAGVLCAADGQNAFVCFAETVLDWALISHHLTLSPV